MIQSEVPTIGPGYTPTNIASGAICFSTGTQITGNSSSLTWDSANVRMALGTNTFSVNADKLYILGSNANKEIVVVDSPSGQTTDLQSWRVNGVVVADVTSTGAIETQNGITFDIPSGNCSLAQISAPKGGSLSLANNLDSTNGNILFNAYTTAQIINQFNNVTKSFFDTNGLKFNNAQTVYFKNSGGTDKEAMKGVSDNTTALASIGAGIKFWTAGFGANTWMIADPGGHLTAGTDNTYDIGASGATRPRSIYCGTSFIAAAGTVGAPSITFTSDTGMGFCDVGPGNLVWATGGVGKAQFQAGNGFLVTSDYFIGFSNATTIAGGAIETRFIRDAANTIAIQNGNNAQTFRTYAGNGANLGIVTVNESLTIAAAATTDSSTTVPAGAVILAVAVRVTTVIPTAATFTVTTTTGGTTLSTAAVSTAANSTDLGSAAGALYTSAGTKIRITPNVQPGAATGVVRLAIMYYLPTAPTS